MIFAWAAQVEIYVGAYVWPVAQINIGIFIAFSVEDFLLIRKVIQLDMSG